MKDYSRYFKNQTPDHKMAAQRKTTVQNLEFEHNISLQLHNVAKHQKYLIKTHGCQANVRDSEHLAGMLELIGYTPTQDIKEADVVLVNTCAIRANAEHKMQGDLGYLKKLKKHNPNLIYGVCGCIAQEEVMVQKLLQANPELDLIFGTHNLHRLPILLEQAYYAQETIVEVWSNQPNIIENLPSTRQNNCKAYVNIMYGCDHFCTYCIVPYTRGKQRSRSLEAICEEIQAAIAAGYQEVMLLGQNVNSYGKDINTSFGELLNAVGQLPIPRVRFATSNPWDFSDAIINAVAKYENMMPYIHLPLQSGDNQILKRMARQNTVESYLAVFDKIKAISNKEIAITTDLIVGFPGETEEQFTNTLRLYDYCQFDSAYTFIYSPRENTPASRMEDVIPQSVKQARLEQLKAKVDYYAKLNNERWVNRSVAVLVEGTSKNNPQQLFGYTPQNKIIHFTGDTKLIGTIQMIRVTSAKNYSLVGVIES